MTGKSDRDGILSLIAAKDNFLITSHINPDGDSIASQLALRGMFATLGKKSTIVNFHPVPRVYTFLPGTEAIKVRRRHTFKPYGAVFVLDCGNGSRAGISDARQNGPVIVNIDHHITNTLFGRFNLVDSKASSTCEVIFDLARRLDIKLDRDIATNLYAGILTDTGSFRYSSTTPRSMSVAGRLLRYGVDPHTVAQEIYENAEFDSLRLLGTVLSRLGRTPDGLVSWVTFAHKELLGLSNISETEEYVNFARSLNSAVIAIGFKEVLPGETRISFRSKGDIDVSALAIRYGGGGHRNAAGCSVKGPLGSVVKKVVKDAGDFLREHQLPRT
jgi:phosphoesterase RecJ-like protein